MKFVNAYFFPILVTISLHAIVVGAMLVGWESEKPQQVIKRPKFVQAKLVTLESKKKTVKPEQKKKPKVVDLSKKRKELERKKRQEDAKKKQAQQIQSKKEAERKKLEQQKKKEEQQKKAEQERLKREEQRKKEQQAFDSALQAEQEALLEESYAVTAQSFMAAVAERIERNWSRPPSARNGMECELKIRLVPTGRVISVDVVRSSGNAQFDRSAEQAVKKVEQFPEVKQMEAQVFERYYRELTLVFKPQDLRQ